MSSPANRSSERNTVVAWREIFKSAEKNYGIENIESHVNGAEARPRILPGLGKIAGSGIKLDRRNARDDGDGDDLILMVSLSSGTRLSASGREVLLGSGDAVLLACTSLGLLSYPAKSRFVSLALPGKVIGALADDIKAPLMLLIPRHSAALQLLAGYINAVVHKDIALTPELRRLVATQVHDLAAFAIDTTRDPPRAARADRSVRRRAIKADIVDKLGRRDLTVNMIAGQHQLSARYVQRLFEDEGTTFSKFVLDRRLDRAHQMLTAPDLTGRAISAVAFACGFGDLSYFNQCFRRRYGMPPSKVRARVQCQT